MLKIDNLKIGYDNKVYVKDFNIHIKKGEILTIIGPNGSGKSTVLKTIGRLIKPIDGVIHLNGKKLNEMNTKDIAKEMACLSQYNTPPKDMTIRKLVGFGRNPHKSWLQGLNNEDEKIINWAIEKTNLKKIENKDICSISGGERQRVWLAMALAQKPEVLLLDEPTTYLDINNQIEILELVGELNRSLGLTVVMVLHDLNQAAKYSENIVILKSGEVISRGRAEDVLTKEIIRNVYNVEMDILKNQFGEKMILIPKRVCKQEE